MLSNIAIVVLCMYNYNYNNINHNDALKTSGLVEVDSMTLKDLGHHVNMATGEPQPPCEHGHRRTLDLCFPDAEASSGRPSGECYFSAGHPRLL